MDWSAATGAIISCSIDRSAWVWAFDKAGNEYKPQLVNVPEKKALLDCQWNLRGDKFLLVSGSGCVYQGFWKAKEKFWTCFKNKKGHKSSIVCGRYSPNGIAIATASTDGQVNIYSAYLGEVDKDKVHEGPFGKLTSRGECLISFKNQPWANFVAWNPKGTLIAYAVHDSNLNFIDVSSETKQKGKVIRWKGLPFLKGNFVDETTLVAAGFDNTPVLFKSKGDTWEGLELDSGLKEEKKSAAPATSAGVWKDKEMQSDVKLDDIVVSKQKNTKHENTIISIGVSKKQGDKISEIVTADPNGFLFKWNV